MTSLTKRLLRTPAALYRWRCGWLLGHRFLLLEHVGRRSGQPRHTVLEVLDYRPNAPEAVVLSALGRQADWLRNITVNGQSRVTIGAHAFDADHRLLDADEAVAVLAGYERHNRIAAPVLRIVLTRLLGWQYRGSEQDRRRLVTQLPLVGFRPRS